LSSTGEPMVKSQMNDNAPLALTKPLRADAKRNRALLLDTARIILSEGQLELRMEEVARRAGVGIGTLYRHFETREALLGAVYQQEIETLCASASDLLATMPADKALAAFLKELVEYAVDNRGLATTLRAGLGPAPSAESLGGPKRLMEAVTLLLNAAVTQERVRADIEPTTVLLMIGSLCNVLEHPGWQQQAQAVVGLLLDGLRCGVKPRL
jgi:AcrR family transcriptional regulator